MKTYQQYINGAWVAPLNGKYTEVYNPSDDSVVGMVANGDEKDADLALQAAQAAQKSWAKLTARRRAEILYAFIEEIKKNKEELAKMILQSKENCSRLLSLKLMFVVLLLHMHVNGQEG